MNDKEINLEKFKVKDIRNINELYKYIINKPYILDIRSKKEYNEKHLCGSININIPLPPLKYRDAKKIEKNIKEKNIPKEEIILVYCKKGYRAGLTKKIMENMGYKNVISLGGIIEEPLKSIIENKNENKKIKICKN
jgi:rhodanese-related sulfurtransferase